MEEKQKAIVYRIKEDKVIKENTEDITKSETTNNLNEFGKIGYDIVPIQGSAVLIKGVPQHIDGELAQSSLNCIYNNAEWKKKIYKPHQKEVTKALGLYYIRGKAILSPKFRKVLTTWIIICEPFGDRWLGFKSSDIFDKKTFYHKNFLDKYCPEEIAKLKELDLIEEYEVPEEEQN